MDAQRLSTIATDAITAVISFHTPAAGLSRENIYEVVHKEVRGVFHLRERAQDVGVAHIEIASDAAVAFAHKFNKDVPETEINPRWLYCCVQNLLTLPLKPELLLDGQVSRLSLPRECQERDDSVASTDEEGSTLSGASSVDSPAQQSEVEVAIVDTSDHEDVPSALVPPVAAAAKDPKTPWTDGDVRQMIRLKASGLTHEEVAARIGRGKGSVENKYGRVMKEEVWKDYHSAQCGARGLPKRSSAKRQARDEDGEEEEEEAAAGPPAPKKSRSSRKKVEG